MCTQLKSLYGLVTYLFKCVRVRHKKSSYMMYYVNFWMRNKCNWKVTLFYQTQKTATFTVPPCWNGFYWKSGIARIHRNCRRSMTITPRYIESQVIQGNGKNLEHFSVQTVATFLRDRNKCVRTYCQLMFDLMIVYIQLLSAWFESGKAKFYHVPILRNS